MAETGTGDPKTGRHPDSGLTGRLGRTRWLVRATVAVERLWPLLLPGLIVVSLFLSLSWLGIFRLLPDWARLGLTVLLGIAFLTSLVALRHFRLPRAAEIDRRIELANRLDHAPVRSQDDTLSPASQDPFAQALWREHQQRMAAKLGKLTGDLPRTRVPERDPWGLRAAAALLLVVAFAFSFGPMGGQPADAFRAHAGVDAVPARIDAWVTPPAYTGKAPLFLMAQNSDDAPVYSVPAGSQIAVRVAGGPGDETLAWLDADGGEEAEIALADAAAPQAGGTALARQFAGTLGTDGLLTLRSGSDELQRWAFNVIPDNPPSIRFLGEPRRAANGALELTYQVEDDYGAVWAEALFAQAEKDANARPLYDAPEMKLALPRRNSTDNAARSSQNLTEHPWAGTQVELTLKAVDAAEQEAMSEAKSVTLPERRFANPLARALVEQRRLLALDANSKPYVVALMDALTLHPEETIANLSHYLGLVSARTRLRLARSDDQLREVADYLWEMALQIEDGALTDAERRLRQAQEALRQALEDGASDEEIEQLMSELREAMRDFLREFAERAQQNQNSAQMQQNMQQLSQSDLERMMDQLENLARSGSRDEAMELLQQLQNMMNNLQAGNQQNQGQGEQSEMRQQMDRLGELMQRQQQMMNETFGLEQQRAQGQMTQEEFEEALRQMQEGQGQLQQDLQALREALEGMGLQPGEGFGDAGEAMGRAQGSLGEGQGEQAVGEQGQALEALRRGAQDMMQQMMQAMEGQDGQGQQGGRQQSSDRDPLGRPRATTGPDFGNSVTVPDEIDVQRAREILEEIRRRLGNALSPEIERNYLERLLEMR